jgi:hypothetical protein
LCCGSWGWGSERQCKALGWRDALYLRRFIARYSSFSPTGVQCRLADYDSILADICARLDCNVCRRVKVSKLVGALISTDTGFPADIWNSVAISVFARQLPVTTAL